MPQEVTELTHSFTHSADHQRAKGQKWQFLSISRCWFVPALHVTAWHPHSPLTHLIAWYPAPGRSLDFVTGTGDHQLVFWEWGKGPMAWSDRWDQPPGLKVNDEETGTEQRRKEGRGVDRHRWTEQGWWCTRLVARGRLMSRHLFSATPTLDCRFRGDFWDPFKTELDFKISQTQLWF